MKRAIIMVGEESIDGIVNENYQLLIGCNYVSSSYDPRQKNHIEFLDEVSEEFAEKIIAEENDLEVGVLNGLKIDETSGKNVKINHLGKIPLEYFSRQLKIRLSKVANGRAMAMSLAEAN